MSWKEKLVAHLMFAVVLVTGMCLMPKPAAACPDFICVDAPCEKYPDAYYWYGGHSAGSGTIAYVRNSVCYSPQLHLLYAVCYEGPCYFGASGHVFQSDGDKVSIFSVRIKDEEEFNSFVAQLKAGHGPKPSVVVAAKDFSKWRTSESAIALGIGQGSCPVEGK